MAGITPCCDARVAELATGKGGHGASGACWRDQHCRHAVDVAALARQGAGHVRRAQAGDGLGQNAGKGADRDGCAVAGRTTGGDAAVAEGRVRELGCVLHWQGQAAVASDVAALAAQGAHADVVARRRNDAETDGRDSVVGRVGGTVALHAVDAGRLRVGVDVGNRRHHREVGVGVAVRTGRAGRGRDVVGRLDDVFGIEGVPRMAISALAAGRMRCVGHIERACH